MINIQQSAPAREESYIEAGFTLAEVAITLFLIGIIIITVVPRLSSVLAANPEAVARHLSTMVRSIREQTIMTHQPYRIKIDIDNNFYSVETLDENAFPDYHYIPDRSILHKPVKLPMDVKIIDVITPVDGKVKEGEAYILFLQDGLFPGAIIHIADSNENPYTLKFLPLTGSLSFQTGYIFEEREEEKL